LIAQERERATIRDARRDWTRRRQPRMRRDPHRLVFLDETSVKTNLTRLRGRAPVGVRLRGAAPFGKWRTQTFIAGLTCDGLIAPWVIEGAMNAAAFETYVRTQLVPELAPGTVVILDNLSTHKTPRAATALRDRGCLVPVPAALQPRPQPDRNGLLETQGASAPHRRAHLRSADRGLGRHLRSLQRRRVLELP